MKMQERETTEVGRRDFLKHAALTVGTVGAAAVLANTAQASVVDTEAETAGYQETNHVRAYYDLARF